MMEPEKQGEPQQELARPPAFRLRRVIILESLTVAMVGLIVWGIAWDLNYPTVGLVIAIIIWVTVSPVIEIATVSSYRKARQESREQ